MYLKMYRKFIVNFIIVLIIISLCGCTTMAEVNLTTNEIYKKIYIGDTVRVKQKNGTRSEFKVSSTENKILAGDGKNIPFDQIQSLEKEQFSYVKTSLLVILGGTFVIGSVVMCSAFFGG